MEGVEGVEEGTKYFLMLQLNCKCFQQNVILHFIAVVYRVQRGVFLCNDDWYYKDWA